MILRIILSKPKLIFGGVRLGAGKDENWIFGYYIPLLSLRRDSWLRHFYKREDIVECSVKVNFFTIQGQILYKYAEWQLNTLSPNSLPNEFPLIYISQRKEIALAGTPMETNATLPPYRVPIGEDIIADVKVFSINKPIKKSRWLIYQENNDYQVRRLKEDEL